MTEEISNKAIRQHAELVADLLRLAVSEGSGSYRMEQLRYMIQELERDYPALEQRRINLMSPQER